MLLVGITSLSFVLAIGITPFAVRAYPAFRTLPSGLKFQVGAVSIASAVGVSYISISEEINPAWIPCVLALSWLVGMLLLIYSASSARRAYEQFDAALATLREGGATGPEWWLHIHARLLSMQRSEWSKRVIRIILPLLVGLVVVMWLVPEGVDW